MLPLVQFYGCVCMKSCGTYAVSHIINVSKAQSVTSCRSKGWRGFDSFFFLPSPTNYLSYIFLIYSYMNSDSYLLICMALSGHCSVSWHNICTSNVKYSYRPAVREVIMVGSIRRAAGSTAVLVAVAKFILF